MTSSMIPHNPQNPLQFDFHGYPIRIIMLDTKPWFVAMDACKALNHSNVSKALNGLKDDERSITKGYTDGVIRDLAIVTLSGLLRLIFRSNKEEAEEFRLWVFNEILPQILYTGNYINPNMSAMDILRLTWQAIDENNAKTQQQISTLQFRYDTLETKVDQHTTELTQLKKRSIKGYHVIADYVFAKKRLETPEKIAIMEQAALKLSAELRYDVHQMDGDRLAFHEEIIKRVMG